MVKLFSRSEGEYEVLKMVDLFQLEQIDANLKRTAIGALTSPAQSTMMDGSALHSLERLYGVEFRHPFYDKALVEFVLSLPPEFIYSQGWIKMLLRYAMKDILPDAIRSRRDKADFYEVLQQQLQAINVSTLLEKENLVSLGLIEQKELERMVQDYEEGNTQHLLSLWTAVNIEYWYQQSEFML